MKNAVIILLLLLISAALSANERPEIMFDRENSGPAAIRSDRGLPIDPWQSPQQVHFRRVGNDIAVYLKTSILLFSGRTLNVRSAKVLGTQMVETPQPNMTLFGTDGTVYSQNSSSDGKIDAFDDGEYINVFGRFTLASTNGRTSLTPDVWYKIDKNNGYIQVKYDLWGNIHQSDPIIEFMRLYVDMTVGNVKVNKVDHFWQGCGVNRENESEWDPWTDFPADLSKDKVFASNKIVNMMMVNNARMGFATEPITFEGMSTEKNLDGYMSYLAKGGEHVFRYTFINHKSLPYKLDAPFEIRFAECYLPFREYRSPRMHLLAGAQTPVQECAKVGVDLYENWGYMGYPYDTRQHFDDMVAFNKNLHRYNIRHEHFCVNWYGVAGITSRYPGPIADTARKDQQLTYGKYFTWDANPDHTIMCLNSKDWFDEYYTNAVHNITDFDGDGVRIDCCTPSMCKNTAHGCSKDYSSECLAYYRFEQMVDTFFKSRRGETGREYTIGAATNIQPSVNAYLNLALSGEGDAGYPREAARDAVYTAFLYGRDFVKLTGGNSPASFDSPKIFEMTIARCGLPTYLFSSNAVQAALWMKYTNPFRVFNVNDCEIHHPFHYDYPKYTRALADKVFPIVYSRRNEALVVICNESENGGSGNLILNADSLGLPKEVMVYDPHSGICRLAKSIRGTISVPVAFPNPWDVDFYLVRPVSRTPEAIWHDVRIWSLNQSWKNGALTLKTTGIPEKTCSDIDIFTAGMGQPVKVSGAELLSYDSSNEIAKLRIRQEGACRICW